MGDDVIIEYGMEYGSILLTPKMRHILASLDSVASAAERIQKEALNMLRLSRPNPRPQPAVIISSSAEEIYKPVGTLVSRPHKLIGLYFCLYFIHFSFWSNIIEQFVWI